MLRRQPLFHRKPRHGAVAVMAALCLTLLLTIVAIVLDLGLMMDERRQGQSTADAAALAAAADLFKNYALNNGLDPNKSARDAALALAQANGYTNDGATTVITVRTAGEAPVYPSPNTSIMNATTGKLNPGYVEVVVQYNQQRTFSNIIGSGALPVQARAVAQGALVNIKAGLILLNPSKNDAFHSSGNGTVTIKGSIIVDSAADPAFLNSGNAKIIADTYEITGKAKLPLGDVRGADGTPVSGPPYFNEGVPPTPDPLKDLPVPNINDYLLQSNNKTSISDDGAHVLNPGVYGKGIDISGNGNVTFNPGVYYLDGGGLKISGNGTVIANNVFFYNTSSQGNPGGQMLISGNGTVTMTPPITGTYTGMSIFQDRTQTDKLQISGNGNVNITGVIYAAKAEVQLSGNGITGVDTLGGSVIADTA